MRVRRSKYPLLLLLINSLKHNCDAFRLSFNALCKHFPQFYLSAVRSSRPSVVFRLGKVKEYETLNLFVLFSVIAQRPVFSVYYCRFRFRFCLMPVPRFRVVCMSLALFIYEITSFLASHPDLALLYPNYVIV